MERIKREMAEWQHLWGWVGWYAALGAANAVIRWRQWGRR